MRNFTQLSTWSPPSSGIVSLWFQNPSVYIRLLRLHRNVPFVHELQLIIYRMRRKTLNEACIPTGGRGLSISVRG